MMENSVLLPTECVSVIASYLEYRDRASLEMVSRIWRLGSMDSYCKTKTLDLNDKLWGKVKVTNQVLEWLLKRCGSKLVTIKLDDKAKTEYLLPEVFEMIIEYCPNIENLHVEGIKLKPDAVLQLATNVNRLRSLSVGPWDDASCTADGDTALAVLLRNNVLLESFKVKGYAKSQKSYTIGKCFLDITATLRHLDVRDCFRPNKFLAKAIKRFHHLESLEIHDYCGMTAYVFSSLIANEALHSTLTTLKINKSNFHCGFSVDAGIALLQYYRNVTTLHLRSCTWVRAETIAKMGTHMTQVKDLDISGCVAVHGEFALDPLANLTKLKSLKMSRLCSGVGVRFLRSLSNLRRLKCVGNSGVTDEDICDLLCNAHSLEYVNVEGCSTLTKRVVDAVYELRKTSRKCPLDIYLYKTNLEHHEKDTTDSKIRIHYEPKSTSDHFVS